MSKIQTASGRLVDVTNVQREDNLAKRRARICVDGPRAFAVRRIDGDLTSATRERGSDGPPIDRKPAPTPAPPPPTRRQP